MFKKFHWGHGIALFYTLFVGILITALVSSFGVDHSLVVDDYYSQDLTYQKQYDKVTNDINSNLLGIEYDQLKNELRLKFLGDNSIQGEIQFYRPSDKSMDFTQSINSSNEIISTKTLQRGKWEVKVDWTQGGIAYYKKEVIFI